MEPGATGEGRTYDVAQDGQRFLMLEESPDGNAPDVPPIRFIVVQNWREELKRRVSTN